MKYIISTTGAPIPFNLTTTRKIVIDTVVPVQVEDIEFRVLDSRLGSQIQTVDVPGLSEEPVADTQVVEEVVTDSVVPSTEPVTEATEPVVDNTATGETV